MDFNLNPERKSIILYAAKCVTGWLLVYGFSLLFNYPEINWALISIILVLSPDEGEAVTLAITGQRPVQEALDQAAKQIDALLKE